MTDANAQQEQVTSDPGLVPAKKPRKPRAPKPRADGNTSVAAKKPRQISVLSGNGIEMVPIATLQANKRNARKHSESQVADLATSIKRFGFNNPIFIDGSNTIWAGHGRVMAAKKAGLTEVPCIRATNLSEAKLRAYALADNRIALNAFWDNDLLSAEIKAIVDQDEPVIGLGFDDSEIKEMMAVTLVMPDLGDLEGVSTTPDATIEGVATLEDQMDDSVDDDGDPLAPVADVSKDRYHQLPPEDASRAIRASEERIPLAILLNRDEHQKFSDYRKTIGARSDKDAFCVLMGWKDLNAMSPQAAAKINADTERRDGDASEAASKAASEEVHG